MKTTLSIVSIVVSFAVPAMAARQVSPEVFKKITTAPKSITLEKTYSEAVLEPTNEVVESFPAPGVEPAPSPTPELAAAAPSPSPSPTPTADIASSNAVPAEQALKWLMNGNIRYVKNRFRADGRTAKDRERILSAATPHAIILAGSDSRVPPEIIFDQMLGEIVVIRVLGPSIDSSVIASIESALQESGPKLLVVLGHTHSQFIGQALKANDGEGSRSESIERALSDVRSRLTTADKENTNPDFAIAAALNADGIARELPNRSEIIRKKVEANELLIKSALYRLKSGEVTFY